MSLLIATTSGVHDPEGGSWLEGESVRHIARAGEDWWAITAGHRVVRNGEPVRSADGVDLNCVQPTPDAVWLGADRARLFHLADEGLDEDEHFADAPGRDRWHTPWGGPPEVRSLAYGPDGVLYVNVHVGGILRYDDTGLTPTVDIDADVHQVAAHPTVSGVVVAATARGLAESTNGRDFVFRRQGLHHSYCRAVAVWGERVMISASRGPRGGEAAVYLGTLGGGELARCEGLGPFDGNVDTHCLAATADGFFVGHGDTVWHSADGQAWRAVAKGIGEVRALA